MHKCNGCSPECEEPVMCNIELHYEDGEKYYFCTPLCLITWLLEHNQEIGTCRICGSLEYLNQWDIDPTICSSESCADKAEEEFKK